MLSSYWIWILNKFGQYILDFLDAFRLGKVKYRLKEQPVGWTGPNYRKASLEHYWDNSMSFTLNMRYGEEMKELALENLELFLDLT